MTVENRGNPDDGFYILLDIEATGQTTVASDFGALINDNASALFFGGDGLLFDEFRFGRQISLGGIELAALEFLSTPASSNVNNQPSNEVFFTFDGVVPAGSDLSDLNGSYSIIPEIGSDQFQFELGSFSLDSPNSGIDFGPSTLRTISVPEPSNLVLAACVFFAAVSRRRKDAR